MDQVETGLSIFLDSGDHDDRIRSSNTFTKYYDMHTGNGQDASFAYSFENGAMFVSSLEGNDRIKLENGVSWNSMEVQGGPQDDTLIVENVFSGGDALFDSDTFDNANGADFVHAIGISVAGNLDIQTGFNQDRVRLKFSEVEMNLKIQTGLSPNDPGEDDVRVRNTDVLANVTVETGGGNDLVVLFWLDCGSGIKINTSLGDDRVKVVYTWAGSMGLFTGSGMDSVKMNEVHMSNNLWIAMGEDEDIFWIENSSSGVAPVFQGGGDDDTFYIRPNLFPNPSNTYAVNFEIFL
ncbi:MAG: hypothetical protein VX768_01470 [Planctomycetota bacterium]|nr:hypothetical protein [Planctomycetota bacterium]